MTVYANIWIKGGSRPLFFRPMGERGSAHRPSVIQIFAYAGYKRGVHSRVHSVHSLLLDSVHSLLLDSVHSLILDSVHSLRLGWLDFA